MAHRGLRRQRGFAGAQSPRQNWADGAFGGYAGQPAPSARGLSCPTSQPYAFPDCDRVAPVCGADLIAANSMEDNITGIAVGAEFVLTITAGDACQFQPRALYIAAYEFQAATTIANANRLPLLLRAANVGNVSMLRRTNTLGAAVITDPFNAQKQLTPVDWSAFSSVNEQSLTLTFQNINNVIIHGFVAIWGDNLSGG